MEPYINTFIKKGRKNLQSYSNFAKAEFIIKPIWIYIYHSVCELEFKKELRHSILVVER
ncbi:Uncharacterised protein [Legionella steigerwaltii]|uniref:Uncharacterized protein n=1 Tax=Legionella steigerwaltii TaxID=460 RepID=A0A378L5T0_9GAMM|nr:hypothetical protein Lstg_3399 [Legionella steigerwaltii]STY21730.1 Uncharacterised protein [Legionella steigerwaltii]